MTEDEIAEEVRMEKSSIDEPKMFSDVCSETATKDNLFDDVKFIVVEK